MPPSGASSRNGDTTMPEDRRHIDELKLLGLIGALLVVMFGWVYNSVTDLRRDQWSEKQQAEYRRGRDREIQLLEDRIERMEQHLAGGSCTGFVMADTAK